jgi:hypothetical protein
MVRLAANLGMIGSVVTGFYGRTTRAGRDPLTFPAVRESFGALCVADLARRSLSASLHHLVHPSPPDPETLNDCQVRALTGQGEDLPSAASRRSEVDGDGLLLIRRQRLDSAQRPSCWPFADMNGVRPLSEDLGPKGTA